MAGRTLSVDGVRVPRFLYGPAWKEDQTQHLAELALRQGFRGIDTANQRRHCNEAAVGQAVSASVASGLVAREDLVLQTKFTLRRGQDHRLPYDPDAPTATQVQQSFANSLEHLGAEVNDSCVLHSPAQRDGLTPPDWEAWRPMEALHQGGRARLLGAGNVTLEQLHSLRQLRAVELLEGSPRRRHGTCCRSWRRGHRGAAQPGGGTRPATAAAALLCSGRTPHRAAGAAAVPRHTLIWNDGR